MWLWIIAALLAYFVKGLCGFANTLVFTSVLGFGVNNVDISPVDLLLGYSPNAIMMWKNRNKLNPRVCIPLAVLVIIGSIPGAILLKHVDAKIIKIIFGVVVIFTGLEMFFREKSQKQTKGSKLFLGIIGFLSGILCGMFGVGALLAAYVGRVAGTGNEFKANLSAVFLADNTFRLIWYSVLGVITLPALKQFVILVPFMLLGLFAGMISSRFVPEKTAKKLVVVLLVISGIMLIIKN